LVVVEARSLHLSHSSRWTAFSCLRLRQCHLEWFLIPLGLLSILMLPLRWPKPCTWGRRPISWTVGHWGSGLGRTWLESSLTDLRSSINIVVLFLLQTVANEIVETSPHICTHMFHHLGI
jgi:hypothetical protein